MGPTAATDTFVGRHADVALLGRLLREVVAGRGQSVLVEGDPGIGKSALLAGGLRTARDLGCEVFWAAADELGQPFPLRAVLDCLDVVGRAEDPWRADILRLLRQEHSPGVTGAGDAVLGAAEQLLALVDRACEAKPVLMVLDDLQWADQASLLVWHRLTRATEQLPLLLVGAYRPVPRRAELDQLRRSAATRGGVQLSLRPLAADEVAELIAVRTGGREVGPELTRLAERAAGNPGYLTELVDALLRENAVRVTGRVTELAGRAVGWSAPASLAAAIADRLGFLSDETTEALRVASLLGAEFAVHDLAVVARMPASELALLLAEAVGAGVITEAGSHLAFRYPLIRQALYDGTPVAVRTALHREAAKALAEAGAPTSQVAQQLLPAAGSEDEWFLDWLAGAAPILTHRAPQTAIELLRRAIDQVGSDDPRRDVFASWLATSLAGMGRNADAAQQARQVLSRTTDPDRVAEMTWVLAYTSLRTGRSAEALETLDQGLATALAPGWRARLLSLTALVQAVDLDTTTALTTAGDAIEAGQAAPDRFAVGMGLHVMSLDRSFVGDERGNRELIDQALTVLGDDREHLDLRLLLLCNRIVADLNLDETAGIDERITIVRGLAEQAGAARFTQVHVMMAAHYFQLGQWDDALSELESIPELTEGRYSFLNLHGLVALIAGHRDDRTTAAVHLKAVQTEPLAIADDRRNAGYVLLARALACERDGLPAQAVIELSPVLLSPQTGLEMNVRYLCLPELTRLALAAGDRETALSAVQQCLAEADEAPMPVKEAAAARCQGLLERDPQRLVTAAEHFRSAGRRLELANALEDASVLFGEANDLVRARAALSEAIEVYTELRADWDIRRADARTRPYGVRRGQRGRRARPTTGWESLTPTELRVAHLVAQGRSNPDIAAALFLSRRTVQTHVSHILVKLAAHSRSEIAREAAHHPVSTVD